MRGFAAWGFPHCVGAMDGCHIYVCVPDEDADAYIDRKHRHSVVLQAVVDHKGVFVDVSVGNVGRDHDAHVLRCSNFFDAMDAGVWVPGNPTITLEGVQIPALIVADAAYPLRSWLMPPHLGHLNAEKANYNRVHNRARCVVERTFGRLKARWRCLREKLAVMDENFNCIISACIILHNVCQYKGDPREIDADQFHHAPLPNCHVTPQVLDTMQAESGEKVRKAITTWLYRRRR